MSQGFIKLYREGGLELLEEDPKAFLLLTQIALRAKRTDKKYSRLSLKTNQAFIGDCEKVGLTKSEYKNAKKRLEKYNLVSFESTSRGTIATLICSDVFDINSDNTSNKPSNSSIENKDFKPTNIHPEAMKKPADNHQETIDEPLTRMKECKKTTTTTVEAESFYECLKSAQLTNEEKHSLMVYPEERVCKAVEWSRHKKIKQTLIQALHWHCMQDIPPLPPEKSQKQSPVERAAWKFNEFLKSYKYNSLVEKNLEVIFEGRIYLILNGGMTTISLKKPIQEVEKDFKDSRNEIMKIAKQKPNKSEKSYDK